MSDTIRLLAGPQDANGLVTRLAHDGFETTMSSPLIASPLVLDAAMASIVRDASVEIATRAIAFSRRHDFLAQVPPWIGTQGMDHLPRFVAVDFAIALDEDGSCVPRLVELHAFPSVSVLLYVLSSMQSRTHDTAGLRHLFVDERRFLDLHRRALARHAAANTALVDIAPERQKTHADLLASAHLFGVNIEDLADLSPDGNGRVRSARTGRSYRAIYNRVVPEEAVEAQLGDRFGALVTSGVAWSDHPAWSFLVSKRSLPLLSHPLAPESMLLADAPLDDIDPDEWVMKPLFSFGGRGVTIAPTRDALHAVPHSRRSDVLLQRKITYAPALRTPAGPRYVELRALLLLPDDGPPKAVSMLARANTEPKISVSRCDAGWTGGAAVWCAQ